jgi:hypothetical protein
MVKVLYKTTSASNSGYVNQKQPCVKSQLTTASVEQHNRVFSWFLYACRLTRFPKPLIFSKDKVTEIRGKVSCCWTMNGEGAGACESASGGRHGALAFSKRRGGVVVVPYRSVFRWLVSSTRFQHRKKALSNWIPSFRSASTAKVEAEYQ